MMEEDRIEGYCVAVMPMSYSVEKVAAGFVRGF